MNVQILGVSDGQIKRNHTSNIMSSGNDMISIKSYSWRCGKDECDVNGNIMIMITRNSSRTRKSMTNIKSTRNSKSTCTLLVRVSVTLRLSLRL